LVHLEVRKEVEDILEVVDDRVVVAEFARENVLQVDSHLFELLR